MQQRWHIFLLLCFVLLTSGCGAGVSTQTEASESNATLENKNDLENNKDQKTFFQRTGIELPTATKVLHFSQVEGGELYVRAKVEMDSATFRSWIANFSREEKHFVADKRYYLEPDNKDWLPSKERKMVAEQILFEEGKILNIGIADLNSDKRVVYIVFHGT